MGAAHNALWAFNARVSLTLPVRRRQQAATLALRPGVVRSLRLEVMAHRPYGSAQTGMYPFALYCGADLSAGFLCQGAEHTMRKGERTAVIWIRSGQNPESQ